MTKTIVTGVDDSPTAAAAARRAAELAVALGADLVVLSAYGKFEMETFASGEEQIVLTSEIEAARTTESVLRELRRVFPSLRVRAEPAEGKPADALVRSAQELNADLIVVGNRRVQGLARMLGSIAREVAAHSPCDVYVVHTHQR